MENFVQLLNSMQPTHSANAVINVQLPEQYSSNTIPLNYSHQIVHKEKGGETIEIPLQNFEVNPFIFFSGSFGDDGLPTGLKLEYPRALQKADFKKSNDVIQINNCNNYIKWQRTPKDWYSDESGNGIIPTQGIQYNHDLDSLTFIAVYKNNKFLYVGALLKMPYTAGDNTDNIQICIPAETLFTSPSDKAPIKIDSNNKSLLDVFPYSLMLMLGFIGVEENERNDNIIKYDLPNISSNKNLLYAYLQSMTQADGDKYRVDKETFLNEYFQELYSSYLALIDSGLSPEEATREFVSALDISTDNFPDLTNYNDFVEYMSNLLVESMTSNSGMQTIRFFSENIQNLFVNSMLYADTTQVCDKSKIHIPNYDSLFSDKSDDYDNTSTQTSIEEDKSEYTFYPLYYNEIDFTKLEVPYYYQILTGGDYSNDANLLPYFNKYQNGEIELSFSLLLDLVKETLTFPLLKYDFDNIVTQICRSSQYSLENNDTILIQYIDKHEDIQYIDNKFIQGLELFHYQDESTKQTDYYFTECELQGSDDLPIPSIGTLPHKKIIDIQPFFEITESIIKELQDASEIENDQILYKSSTSSMDDKEYQFTIDQSKFAQDIKTITFSSNSFIKFDQEVLNVHQRDGRAYELSYSYGTLSNGTQYIKLLFDGYSSFSNSTDDVKLRYVVFRLTDGRIILFMKTKPTNSNYMGIYSFNDTTFTASTSQPTILGPTEKIIYDEPQYITWSGGRPMSENASKALITSQDQYVLKINGNNILTFNYEDCIKRISDDGKIILAYENEEFQEYILSIKQLNDSTEASNIPFPENGLCIQFTNDGNLYIRLIGSVNQITPNDKIIIERLIHNTIVSSPKIAPYYANERHGEIFNDYNYNCADGKYSHAEGYHNTIYSNAHYSHIEGNNNIIIGVNNHCEGAKNSIMSNYSHAEGYETTVYGDYSHAEGYKTKASGSYTHAEGSGTTASGTCSHAEGSHTTASNYRSHAEGYGTTASGEASHAEGYKTTASGEDSHAEGYQTTASNYCSHASGYKTKASGNISHAEGSSTTASGSSSHAEGSQTTASNSYSHAEGYKTTASGNTSHAEGNNTTASGNYSHTEGTNTIASSEASHAEGTWTTASGTASHAENYYTTANGGNSHAEGKQTTAVGIASHAEGSSSNKATAIISNLSAKTSVSTIIEAWKSKKFSLAFGNNSSCSGLDCLALTDYSHAEGYQTTASGGNSSHAEGYQTTASGNSSHAEGYQTTANNLYSHAEGFETTASGVASHAEGNNTTASGGMSHAEGYRTTASNHCSHASGKYNATMTTGGGASNTTGTAFVIGNGTDSSVLSNAFSVQYDGTVKAKSTITASTTADYAEFFEWLDGNPDNEDRVGYFVTLDGDKIKIASNEDDYILGVISGEPFVLGNGDCDTWNEMYLHDEFRRTIYEPAPKVKEVLDEEGHPTGEYEVVEGEYEGTRPVLNPKYDPSKVYISRFERKEWSPVGMLGVLAVRHDGTAKVNGYVTVNKDGIATACDRKSEKSYRVIKSKTDNVVEIIFR